MKILLTGGAGYIGTTLIPLLLQKKYEVTVVDALLYGGDQLIPFFKYKNFSFVKGDIRDKSLMKTLIKDKDVIIHLAAIVGYPACRDNAVLATTTNVDGTKIISDLVGKDQYVLYGSTSSNYGEVNSDYCTEAQPLNPQSLYGETKTKAELLITQNTTHTAFRFATAFGVSPRLRLDLLINEFVFLCTKQRYLLVYEPEFMRSFIHVSDMARVFVHALNNFDLMKNEVFNVGSDKMNYTKGHVAELVRQLTNATVQYKNFDNDIEKRNYLISYEKIKKTGFDTKISLKKGVSELIKAMDTIKIPNPYINN